MAWFNVGKVVNTHGIRGEVRVISKTDFPEERYKKGSQLGLFKVGSNEPIMLTIASSRTHKNFMLLTFEGYPNINDVEPFRDGILKVSDEHLSDLEENEFYFHEIIGCKVEDESGNPIGTVKEIFQTGANDVWGIKGTDNKDHFIPYIEDVVKEINIAEKKIVIHVIEGLLS